MRSAVVIALALIALGAFVHPLLTGARTAPALRPPVAPSADALTPSADVRETPATLQVAPPAEPSKPSLDARLDVTRGTEGFWRIGRTEDGVWWFISPEGTPEFLNTVTTVVPFQHGRDPAGPHYVSRDWSGPGDRFDDGDAALWATRTLQRVREVGFKGLGAWCHPAFHDHDIPITRDLNLWTWIASECRRFYSPQWAATAEDAVRRQVIPLRDNRNLVGYFLDNELDWGDGGAGPGYYFDRLPADDPNRLQVLGVIRELWPTIADFNRDWGTDYESFTALQHTEALPAERGDAYGRLMGVWIERLARDYFALTTRLVRQYDPNHLILGVRYKGYAPREVVRASRNLTDVQSLNYYVADGRLDYDMFRMMTEESGGQPVMITEYAFHALDGRSGNRNNVGFAAQVPDQQARADGYRLFTTRLARVPWVIGADWFQWSDEPPSGRRMDGEDVNFGIVDVDDRIYETLADAVRSVTPLLNDLHAASPADPQADVWRESFAVRPTIDVPYLASPPRLNGELSDWPAAARVQGMQRGPTIGLERSKLPLPQVFMAWNEAGVYLGFEVFDDDIQAAPAAGWWWTRDNVEFWISTRPVASDQVRYDANSHQFFFVPQDPPGPDGVGGVVGQWHRPGDALADHLIPHPLIRPAVRVLPGRYVVEMLIPTAALHGFDPEATHEIAVNFHVRNFQHATEYFWSAPKEVMTQLRPNTWGLAYLRRPAAFPAPSADARVP